MVHFLFGFENPKDNPRKAEILDYFEHTDYMKKAQEEASIFPGLYYQVLQTDEDEMAFEHQRMLNPSTYILRIERVFRVWHSTQKKEFFYWYVSRQVRGMSPSEKQPAMEFEHQGFKGIHPKPICSVGGYDYRQRPINVRVKGTEWVFEEEWNPTRLMDILADSDNKFGNTTFWVAEAPLDTSREAPSPKYQVKNIEDFKQGNIFDLMEMAQSRTEFTNLEEFQETKAAQKRAKADLVVKKVNRRVDSTT